MVRKDIESLYIATCDIYEYQKTKDKYGVTEHQKLLVLEKQRCRLCLALIKITKSPYLDETM